MKFFLDHDVPSDIGRILTQSCHNVSLVREVLSPTASDQKIFDYAKSRQLILISCNRDDFIRLAAGVEHPGIIILIRRRTRIAECAALLKFLKKTGETGIRQNINFA